MSSSYELLVYGKSLDLLLRQRPRTQDLMWQGLQELVKNPFVLGTVQFTSVDGRLLSVMVWRKWRIIYWADHPAKQACVVNLQPMWGPPRRPRRIV
jgi:hypothetical protein